MTKNQSIKYLNRYTSLAALIQTLMEKKITLLNPDYWDDKNDVYFLKRFSERTAYKNVRALCFSTSYQTYHHWKVFADGPHGVCIQFDPEHLLSFFSHDPKVTCKMVQYMGYKQAKKLKPWALHDLRFLKHSRYRDEKEFRIISCGKSASEELPSYEIDLECISRITLSPWLPAAFVESIKSVLRSIDGCEGLSIYRSTITTYRDWCSLADFPRPTR